jgi:ABC-2 type transport system ATP-binding protein
LIKLLAGQLRPCLGEVVVCGKRAWSASAKSHVGYCPDADVFYEEMSGRRFVLTMARLHGFSGRDARDRTERALAEVGMSDRADRRLRGYSKGMRQRIKLAQALVHGPKLLFLDEPTNGLDPQGRDEMLTLVKDVSHGKGLSVIVSSHLLPDIEKTCDDVIVMRRGEVVAQGPISQLKQTGGWQIEVELRNWSEAFGAALRARGGREVWRQGTTGRFEFDTEPKEPIAKLLFSAARESGAQVRGFRPAVRSLEDIFLEAVRQ